MDVDEPRCNGQAGRVDVLPTRLERADDRDPAILHADVGHTALGTGAVVDRAAADDEVEAHARVALPSSMTTP